MRTKNASLQIHVARAAEYTWVAAATLIVTLVLAASVGAPLAAADTAPMLTGVDQWLADGGYYQGAYPGPNLLPVAFSPQIDQADVARWASAAGYYAGGYPGASPLSLAVASQTGQSDVDRWAARGGYYQGAYPGANPLTAPYTRLIDRADYQCWAMGAGYYSPAYQGC
jgi:hypothetical protein